MADGTITIDINANENVSDSLNKVKSDAKSLESGLKGSGKQATLLGKALKGVAVASTITATATAVYKFGKACVESYSQYEQMVGGVQQLFGKDAQRVIDNSSKAFKTAGMSMNEYMNNASQFSAKLIRDLGDTKKATEYVDKAMIQISDNVNTFGTDLDSVTRAYQGFAREQYTMLDNLKLGYSGTKQGMEELLADAEKISGRHFELGNFADMVDAIQVVQDELNITGKTALEAETTIEGATKSMSASWENLKIAIASGENVEEATQNFVESVGTLAKNLAPVLKQIAVGTGEALSSAIKNVDWGKVAINVGNFALDGVDALADAFLNTFESLMNVDWGNVAIDVGSFVIDGVEHLADTFVDTFGTAVSMGLETTFRDIFGDDFTDKFIGKDLRAQRESAFDTMQPFFDAMKDSGIETFTGIGKVWNDKLYEALMEGDTTKVAKVLADINHAMEDNGSNVRLHLNAEGEIEFTNLSEMMLQCNDELKQAVESGDDELVVEKAITWKMQADTEGQSLSEITQGLTDLLTEYGKTPEEVTKIIDLVLSPEEKDSGALLTTANDFVKRKSDEVSGIHGLAEPTVDEQVGIGEQTETATHMGLYYHQQIKAKIEADRQNAKSKVDHTVGIGKQTNTATDSAKAFLSSVKSGIDGMSANATATVNVTVKANILGTIQGIMSQVKSRMGGNGIPSGLQDASNGLLGDSLGDNAGTLGANGVNVLEAGSGANNTFYRIGRTLVESISKGVQAGQTMLSRVFDRMFSRIETSAERNAEALGKVYDGLADKYKELDERAEKYQLRLAEITVEENKAKLNTGKTALENEKLEIAYEQSKDALIRLGKEYKDYEQSLKSAEEEERRLKDREEELKREKEDLIKVQKDLNTIYKEYKEGRFSAYTRGSINVQDDLQTQKKQVSAMEKLPDVLGKLQERGMPIALIQQLLNLDPVTALEVAQGYLRLSDKKFNAQMDIWSRGETANSRLSVYASGVNGDEAKMFDEMLDLLRGLPTELGNTILQNMKVDEFKRLGFDDNQVHLDFKLTWDTMTANDLARLLAPMITAEQERSK